MRVMNASDFEDFRSVVALQQNYIVAEPFIGMLMHSFVIYNTHTHTHAHADTHTEKHT
jgi:hypothetical protein